MFMCEVTSSSWAWMGLAWEHEGALLCVCVSSVYTRVLFIQLICTRPAEYDHGTAGQI